MANPSGKKTSHAKAGAEKSRTAGYLKGTAYPAEYLLELTPLDVIKQDTDILNDDIRHVFELPPNPMEVADYLGHYFLPAEKAA
jgi:hypothetical protein